MPRRGPPQSFGWLCLKRYKNLDTWETPTGYQLVLDKNAWLEEQPNGIVVVIDPPPKEKA